MISLASIAVAPYEHNRSVTHVILRQTANWKGYALPQLEPETDSVRAIFGGWNLPEGSGLGGIVQRVVSEHPGWSREQIKTEVKRRKGEDS